MMVNIISLYLMMLINYMKNLVFIKIKNNDYNHKVCYNFIYLSFYIKNYSFIQYNFFI